MIKTPRLTRALLNRPWSALSASWSKVQNKLQEQGLPKQDKGTSPVLTMPLLQRNTKIKALYYHHLSLEESGPFSPILNGHNPFKGKSINSKNLRTSSSKPPFRLGHKACFARSTCWTQTWGNHFLQFPQRGRTHASWLPMWLGQDFNLPHSSITTSNYFNSPILKTIYHWYANSLFFTNFVTLKPSNFPLYNNSLYCCNMAKDHHQEVPKI